MITNIAQPLIDLIISCPHEFLVEHNLTPGSYGMVTKEEQTLLLSAATKLNRTSCIGGSSTNSLVAAKLLGVEGSLLGLVGRDQFGDLLHEILQSVGINTPLEQIADRPTGTCLSFVTPDGERTMRTHLGVASDLSPAALDLNTIKNSSWLLVEGYLLTGSEANTDALRSAIRLARENQTKVAFLASADFVIASKRKEIIEETLPECDMVFYNRSEALLLAQSQSIEEAARFCSSLTPSSVITLGAEGAIVNIEGEIIRAKAKPPSAPVVDTTGAGDVFAGALLAGLLRGLPTQIAADGASALAAKIVTRHGAQVEQSNYAYWEAVVGEQLAAIY
jgi:sugar/nucleoside kinase (ribokinase family)